MRSVLIRYGDHELAMDEMEHDKRYACNYCSGAWNSDQYANHKIPSACQSVTQAMPEEQ